MATNPKTTGTSSPTSDKKGVPPVETARTEIKDIPPSDTPLSEEELRKVKGGQLGSDPVGSPKMKAFYYS